MIVFFTGAGVSAESGLATYRSGGDATWSNALFEKYANPQGYARHLPESFQWYKARAAQAAAASPNAAHVAIAALERRVSDVLVVTQNVDGLHRRAGSSDVIELHGNLRQPRCDACGNRVEWTASPDDARCNCGGLLRPDVVMFGEFLDEAALDRARDAAERCDVLVSVGTSNFVWPAAEVPMLAFAAGARVYIVNTDHRGQPVGENIIHVTGKAAAVLPSLLETIAP